MNKAKVVKIFLAQLGLERATSQLVLARLEPDFSSSAWLGSLFWLGRAVILLARFGSSQNELNVLHKNE